MSSTEGQFSTAGETNGDGSSSPMGMAATYARKLRPYLSEHARSGSMSGVTGGLSVLRGIRALRRGKRGRGLARIAMGLVIVGIAVTQRRNARERNAAGVDQSDVVSTAPDDLEAAATEDDAGVEHHEDVGGTVDTGADVGDVEPEERGDDLGEGDVDEREVVDTGTDAADAVEEGDDEAEAPGESGEDLADDADEDGEIGADEDDAVPEIGADEDDAVPEIGADEDDAVPEIGADAGDEDDEE